MGTSLSRLIAILAASALPAFSGSIYSQANLVSDIPGMALITDPSLVNPWGISDSATSPWWVSDNGTGLSTVYSGTGAKVAITVTVPPPPGRYNFRAYGTDFQYNHRFQSGRREFQLHLF
jgi:hypothetical protein